MITIIGNTHTVIGFGLCGLDDVHEVKQNIASDELLMIIKNAKHDIVMLDQNLMKGLKKIPQEKVAIPIPASYEKDDIDALITDTLGIEIEE